MRDMEQRVGPTNNVRRSDSRGVGPDSVAKGLRLRVEFTIRLLPTTPDFSGTRNSGVIIVVGREGERVEIVDYQR